MPNSLEVSRRDFFKAAIAFGGAAAMSALLRRWIEIGTSKE